MDFDHLLREYLSGSLSDSELEQFRTLLDSVPEYRAELRQTLEVRSLIQDDAMSLVPPSDLADHVRIAVGSSFAADALAEREEIERRRTGIPYAIRISASTLAAVCLLVGVALTPTLPPVSVASERTAQVASGSQSSAAPLMVARAAVENGRSSANTRPAANTVRRAANQAMKAVFWVLGHEVPYRSVRATSADNSSGIAQNQFPDMMDREMTDGARQPYSSMLSHDPAEILYRNFSGTSYSATTADTTQRSQPSNSLAFEAKPGEIFSMQPDKGRSLAFGVTIGSGKVTETEDANPLLQKSCYMSFSVSHNDRVGLEMGVSAFQQRERLRSDGIGGKFTNVASYNPHDIAGLANDMRSQDPQSDIFFAKEALGIPSQESDVKGGQSTVTLRNNTPQPDPPAEREVRTEQQISYGGIFYDRRFEVSRSWDLCGRLTVSGADNAVVGSIRAYAAFNPTKNVTLTMGIGGSGLRNFSSKGTNLSANYGVYYGIETGF